MKYNTEIILDNLKHTAKEFAKNYTVRYDIEGLRTLLISHIFNSHKIEVEIKHNGYMRSTYVYDGEIIVNGVYNYSNSSFQCDGSNWNVLGPYLMTNDRSRDWWNIVDTIESIFESNTRALKSFLSGEKKYCSKYVLSAPSTSDIKHLFDIGFDAYTQFDPDVSDEPSFQVEASHNDLTITIDHNETDGKLSSIDITIAQQDGKFVFELYQASYRVADGYTGVSSIIPSPIPEEFDKGFAKFQLLSALIS